MKKIMAIGLLLLTVVLAGSSFAATASCCQKGAACCQAKAACCVKK
ncbi:MAG: hypothetical protein WC632_01100 [Candidatus Margulisiibacteriota bacterium]